MIEEEKRTAIYKYCNPRQCVGRNVVCTWRRNIVCVEWETIFEEEYFHSRELHPDNPRMMNVLSEIFCPHFSWKWRMEMNIGLYQRS